MVDIWNNCSSDHSGGSNNFKKKNSMKYIIYIIIIIVVIAAIIFGIKYWNNRGNKKVKGGSVPTADDINCASGGTGAQRAANPSTSAVIIGNCTKPEIWPVESPMKQKCFTSAELGLSEGDSAPDKVTDSNGFGTTWYFNFQSGDRFCYRSPQYYKQ